MRIFVTGGSGFVGGAAIKNLIARGHTVRAMSRSEASDTKIAALGAEPVPCELIDPNRSRLLVNEEHIGNAEIVIHCAAFVEQWGPARAWMRTNAGGTTRVLAAARGASVKRFIHISTESVLWRGQHLRGVDETYPIAPYSPYPYAASKALAEHTVLGNSQPGFETISLRPRFIWGPGDTTLLPVIERMASSGRWRWIDHGKAMTTTTHIANLVHAIELALTKGRSGEAYFILDDGVRTMKQIVSAIAATRGIALPDASIPSWVADSVATVAEGVWRTFNLKGEPPLTRFSAMIMSRDAILKGDKARAEMGYAPVISVEEGLRTL